MNGGVTIRRAVKSFPWPSKSAVLEYSAVWVGKVPLGEGAECISDGVQVSGITTSLDPESRVSGPAHRLAANSGISFIGSYVPSKGFVLEIEEAEYLTRKDERNRDVLFPCLNGEDLNNRWDCSASRWVINFHDWSLDRAKSYPDVFALVE